MIYLTLWKRILQELGRYETKLFKKVMEDMDISYSIYSFTIDNLEIYFRRGSRPILRIRHRKNSSSEYKEVFERHITPQIVDKVTKVLEEIKRRADEKEKHFRV